MEFQQPQLDDSNGDGSEEDEEELEVMMAIEINFGNNRKGEVIVCHGDDPVLLAEVMSIQILGLNTSKCLIYLPLAYLTTFCPL